VELKDIAYYERHAKMGVWCRDSNDLKNLKMWTELYPKNVFIWHEEDNITSLPFILGIQTPWQKRNDEKVWPQGGYFKLSTLVTGIVFLVPFILEIYSFTFKTLTCIAGDVFYHVWL
jgi:hypothetical protein